MPVPRRCVIFVTSMERISSPSSFTASSFIRRWFTASCRNLCVRGWMLKQEIKPNVSPKAERSPFKKHYRDISKASKARNTFHVLEELFHMRWIRNLHVGNLGSSWATFIASVIRLGEFGIAPLLRSMILELKKGVSPRSLRVLQPQWRQL